MSRKWVRNCDRCLPSFAGERPHVLQTDDASVLLSTRGSINSPGKLSKIEFSFHHVGRRLIRATAIVKFTCESVLNLHPLMKVRNSERTIPGYYRPISDCKNPSLLIDFCIERMHRMDFTFLFVKLWKSVPSHLQSAPFIAFMHLCFVLIIFISE